MGTWRKLCLFLLLGALGSAWAEADTEDATCQLEILKHPGKGKALAKAKHNKGKRKTFELLKIKSKSASKKAKVREVHHTKAKSRKANPGLDLDTGSISEKVLAAGSRLPKQGAERHLRAHGLKKGLGALPKQAQPKAVRAKGAAAPTEETAALVHHHQDAHGKKTDGPTFAVTTRIYAAELPYLKHFLNYYLHDLQVKRVYLFCTDDAEETTIRSAVRGFGFPDQQVTFVRGKRNQSLQRLNYHAVQEDFLLDVDCDEFLVPPKGGLRGIIDSDPHADAFNLQWTCYPSDARELDFEPKGIPCTGYKGMIRTKSLHDENGHYKFVEGTPVCGGRGQSGPCVFSKQVIPLAHIQYRGFWDSVLKDVSSPAGSQWMLKGQPKSVAMQKIRQGQPPKRMQSLAFEMVCVERFGTQLLSEHGLKVPRQMKFSIDGMFQSKALAKAGVDRVLKMQAEKGYRRYKEALQMSFDKLLCEPKQTCANIKPNPLTKLLEKMSASKLRAYDGACKKPESGGHEVKFTQRKPNAGKQKKAAKEHSADALLHVGAKKDVQQKEAKVPTFAVTTRVYEAELPYLHHFLKHYLHDVKVKRVYLWCTEKSEEPAIRAAVRGFGFSENQVTFVDGGSRVQNLQRMNYHVVKEDYLLDVDCDEFLVPPPGGLCGVVGSDPHADVFYLQWTCYPSDELKLNFQPKGLPCTGLKGMIKTKSMHDHNGHFEVVGGMPQCGGRGPCIFSKHVLSLAHIQYRGFWDSVLKDVSSQAGSQWMLKGQPRSVAMKEIRNGRPGKRMMSLAFEMVCIERYGTELLSHEKLKVPRQMKFGIDASYQTKALAKAGLDRVMKMQAGKGYQRYKAALHKSFDRLLCNPKAACIDIKPFPVSKMLEKLSASKLSAYNGHCQSPETSGHAKFALDERKTSGEKQSTVEPDEEASLLQVQVKDTQEEKEANTPTFAVTTRVYEAELPYLRHFLRYYLHDVKVKRVYLFCTKKSKEPAIRAAVRGFGFSDNQVTFVDGKRSQNLQRMNYHAVKEDFLLDVDCDEFVVPPKGGLRGVVGSDPHADAFHLEWTCYPSDDLKLGFKPRGIPCTGYKGMIRTKSMHDHNGKYSIVEGTPTCGGKGRCIFSKHTLPLAHIQYRGFWDSVLKDVSSPAGSQWMLKGQPRSVAMREIRNGQPGKRMAALAFEMVCIERFGTELLSGHKLKVPRKMQFAIDGSFQTKALAKAGLDRVMKMQADKGYRRYKEALRKSFDRLLCDPKKTCRDIKPAPVSKMLETISVTKLRAYNGRCHRPETAGHKIKFALDEKRQLIEHVPEDASLLQVQVQDAGHHQKTHTFAVTTRIYRAELPYLKPFLSHYIDKLATDRIYLFCTNPSEQKLIANKVNALGYKKRVTFLGAADPQKLQKLNYSAVTEDWIIDVDVDEFLRPPEFSLKKIVESEPEADMFELQWLCYPCDTTHGVARPYPLPCVGLKGMVKSKAFIPDARGVYDVHGGVPRCTQPCKVGKKRYILNHYQYRGFYDALLRDISSPEGSQWMLKGQPKDVAFEKLRQGEPGNRLKSLAFEMVCVEAFGRSLVRSHENTYGPDHAPMTLNIERELQSQIVEDSGVDAKLGDIALTGYLNYKAALKGAFDKLLCDPKDACNIRPLHVTTLLSNMTLKDLKHYQGKCHKGVALEL